MIVTNNTETTIVTKPKLDCSSVSDNVLFLTCVGSLLSIVCF